eukprot:COSAG06_NODE_8051_length_2288_cov_1.850160_1_plen_48_part_10
MKFQSKLSNVSAFYVYTNSTQAALRAHARHRAATQSTLLSSHPAPYSQ